MIAEWPEDDLGCPLRRGFSEGFTDPRQMTAPEAGPPRVRPRFSRTSNTLDLSFSLTWHERDVLTRFWEEDTQHGTVIFAMPEWPDNNRLLLDDALGGLTDETGTPLRVSAYFLALFATPPNFSPYGSKWLTAFQVHKMP